MQLLVFLQLASSHPPAAFSHSSSVVPSVISNSPSALMVALYAVGNFMVVFKLSFIIILG